MSRTTRWSEPRRGLDAESCATATARLMSDSALRDTTRTAERRAVEDRDWTEAGRRFWAASQS